MVDVFLVLCQRAITLCEVPGGLGLSVEAQGQEVFVEEEGVAAEDFAEPPVPKPAMFLHLPEPVLRMRKSLHVDCRLKGVGPDVLDAGVAAFAEEFGGARGVCEVERAGADGRVQNIQPKCTREEEEDGPKYEGFGHF